MSPLKLLTAAVGGLLISASAQAANYQTIDLSPYVNEGFTNSWFGNGWDFQIAIAGQTTYGNQGSSVPFAVANVSDGNGSFNNFWFGNYSGPGSLFGPQGSFTVPINLSGVTSFNSLADNVFGAYGAAEFEAVLNYASGAQLTGVYIGGVETKDYNYNCVSTGCANTPRAQYWYANGNGQWLQVVSAALPTSGPYQTLQSITFTQLDGTDGAILACLTLGLGAPEPATWALMLLGVGLTGSALRRRRAAA